MPRSRLVPGLDRMIVMKFGGTSVDGPERIVAVAKIVGGRNGESPVVVTSAMRGVTDDLNRMVEVALSGDRESLDRETAALRERHLETAAAIAPRDAELRGRIEDLLRELRVLLRGVRLVGVATPRSADAVLGFGELLAQELLVAAMKAGGLDGVVVDSRDVVVTDDRFGAASPHVERTEDRFSALVAPLVERGALPVLGGYVGGTGEGIPTTLGRGGSDLTAALLGLVGRADAVEIWTDVDGLMSCDPRIASDALVLRRATFLEASELAGYGARVLHPSSVYPAVRGGIDVVIRNSMAPETEGTRIAAEVVEGDGGGRPIAVAGRRGLLRVTIRDRSGRPPALLTSRLADGARVSGASPLAIALGAAGASCVVDGGGAAESFLACVTEGDDTIEVVSSEEGLAAVALVGEGVATSATATAMLTRQAAKYGSLGLLPASSGAALAVLVGGESMEPLMRSLHLDLLRDAEGERHEEESS